MPFGKYHVVIFKERSGSSRSLRLRGWLGVAVCLVFCLLVAGNIWFGRFYLQARALETRLAEAERSLDERQSQLVGMVGELTAVRNDLQRVQSFDAKLRLMMNIDVGVSDASVGGASSEDLSLGYLPLHRQEMASRKIRLFLQELSDEIRLEEVQQQELLLSMRENRDRLAAMPSIWPVEGFVSSGFGSRSSPFTGRVQTHKGLDIAARMGTPYVQAGGQVRANRGAWRRYRVRGAHGARHRAPPALRSAVERRSHQSLCLFAELICCSLSIPPCSVC